MRNAPSGRCLSAMMAVGFALGAGCAGSAARLGAPGEPQGSAPQLYPALLTARPAWTGEIRGAKLRVWAEPAYRAQSPQWQQELDDDVAYANRVLIPMLGVALAAEYLAWDHRAQGGEPAAELAALIQTDPGDDVMWVVGITGGAA